MLLSGRSIIQRAILTNLKDSGTQIQPCGVDVRLKAVFQWSGPGTLDFSNHQRRTGPTGQLKFEENVNERSVCLPQGSYVVEFHELLNTPLDVAGQVLPRSSLWRSGGLIHAGIVDAGYSGAFGAVLQVLNPHGIVLHEDARIAQVVFHMMGEGVGEGYSGTYQGSEAVSTDS